MYSTINSVENKFNKHKPFINTETVQDKSWQRNKKAQNKYAETNIINKKNFSTAFFYASVSFQTWPEAIQRHKRLILSLYCDIILLLTILLSLHEQPRTKALLLDIFLLTNTSFKKFYLSLFKTLSYLFSVSSVEHFKEA